MKFQKLTVLDVQELAVGAEVDVNDGFLIQGNKLISYKIESKFITEETINAEDEKEKQKLENAKLKKEQAYQEFVEKHQIRCGAHFLHQEHGMLAMHRTEEKFFETATSSYLKKLFTNFFDRSDFVWAKFKKNKRAYLLHSDPGMGKSVLLRSFTEHALKKEGTAVIQVDGDVNFNILHYIFLRDYAADVKRIILIIEDFGKKDSRLNGTTYNPSCLNFLDGTNGLFRVPTMILCTTNFVKELGPHLTNRPGRFNKLIQVLPPTDEEIFQLVENIGNIKLSDFQKQVFKGRNMTPDHVVEAIIRHEIEEISLEESVNQVLREREGLTHW